MAGSPGFGTCQAERYSRSLDGRRVQLDARSSAQMLAMGPQFAALFAFYGTDGARAGTFERFFQIDAQLYAASIATHPVSDSRRIVQSALALGDDAARAYVADTLLALWKLLDLWCSTFPKNTPFERFREHMLREVAERATVAVELMLGREPITPFHDQLCAFASQLQYDVWGAPGDLDAASDAAVSDAQALTRSAHLTLFAVESIVNEAKSSLAKTDPRYARAPQVALYVAFLSQLQHVRDRLNAIPARHLNFYYREVLRQRPLAAQPDQTWVVMQTKPGMLLPTISVGQIVTGAAVRFKTRTTLALSHARISALRTLFVELGPSSARRLHLTPRAIVAPAAIVGSDDGWPTFGALVQPTAAVETAPIGFAIECAALEQLDGARTLTLEITPQDSGALPESCKTDLFAVMVSCGARWLTAAHAQTEIAAAPQASERCVRIHFELPANLPPASAPAASEAWPAGSASAPVVNVTLAAAQAGWAPDWLCALRVSRVDLTVEVTDANAGTVITAAGQLSSTGAGAPFGPAPDAGAFLELSRCAALRLAPAELGVTIHWQGLPTNTNLFEDGFSSYYQGYVLPFDGTATATTPAAAAPPKTAANSGSIAAWGVDVSHYQRSIDWQRVQRQGAQFCWVKRSEGRTNSDPTFARNWSGAKAAGLTRGAYHLYRPQDDVQAQVDNFLAGWQRAYDGELPAALDLEWAAVSGSTQPALLAGVRTWLQLVAKAIGKTPLIYAGEQVMHFLGTAPALSVYPRWLAVPRQRGAARAAPSLAPGWERWAFWQRGSASVDGIAGAVDIDVFCGDAQALAQYVSSGALSAQRASVAVAPSPAPAAPPTAAALDFHNHVFELTAAALSDDAWRPRSFQVAAGSVVQRRGLFVDAQDERLRDGPRRYQLQLAQALEAPAQALRLQLAGPFQGFGKALFATSVNNATLANAEILLGLAKGQAQAAQPSQPATKPKDPKPATPGKPNEIDTALHEADSVLERTGVLQTITRWSPLVGGVLALFKFVVPLFRRIAGPAPAKLPANTSPQPAPATTPSKSAPPSEPLLRLIPQPPFTPIASRIALDFTVSFPLYLSTSLLTKPPPRGMLEPNKLWHVGPFGVTPALTFGDTTGDEPPRLLPLLQDGNALYMDIEDVAPQDAISLLWAAVPESDAASPAPALRWETLAADGGWTGANIQVESEPNPNAPSLMGTSLIVLHAPPTTHTKLQLRVVDPARNHAGRTLGIYRNAVSVERIVDSAVGANGNIPIPAGSLIALEPPVPAVTVVTQPVWGQGGRAPESSDMFTARVSERLRHKARALTSWDYERLTLEAADDVFAARCLPNTALDLSGVPVRRAGAVTLVLVPRVYAPGGGAQGFPPRFASDRLESIRRSLTTQIPMSAELFVRATTYREVKVQCVVQGTRELAPLEVAARLQTDLRNRLSGWVFAPAEAESVPAVAPDDLALRLFLNSLSYLKRVCSASLLSQAAPLDPWVLPLSSLQHEIEVQ